jgi:hypothetical protein
MSKSKLGIKHLIECHCTLVNYKGNENHLYHKFCVYSKLNKSGKVIEKIARCNNCQTLHKVYDICKSDIIRNGKDENKSALTLEDIELQISTKIANILRKYNVDISTYEHILDILENECWDEFVVLSRELIEFKYHVKILKILDHDKIKIITKVIEDEIYF